jgi:hypothetical protein
MNAVFALLLLLSLLAAAFYYLSFFRWLFAIWFPRLRRGEERPGARAFEALLLLFASGFVAIGILILGKRLGLL